jgi:type III secretion protein R
MRKPKAKVLFFLLIFLILSVGSAHAQTSLSDNPDQPLILMFVLAALSLAPFVLIMVTSFVKISVVLSILRNAMGTQQIPPTQVITGLAFILTIYIMAPVGIEIKNQAGDLIDQKTGKSLLSTANANVLIEGAKRAAEPIRNFLIKHAHPEDRALFLDLARKQRKPEDRAGLTDKDLIILVPSFVISQLKEAFEIGFILFVPFIIIDMVVSNILLAMGMFMLSPVTVSLPFKLLLFILVDGWYLLARGLVIGYL